MLAVERKKRIIEQLHENKRVVVSDLSKQFGVSGETIRRDLEKLDREGIVTKSYGGAVLTEEFSMEMPFGVRLHRVAKLPVVGSVVYVQKVQPEGQGARRAVKKGRRSKYEGNSPDC